MKPSDLHPFEKLTPEFIMTAVEGLGFRCDCRNFPLNSYENRVYQVGIEENPPLIAKFYRPGRWSDAQLAEEHAFCLELAGHELPVVAPWADEHGQTLFHAGDFTFALYPRQGGHAPELDNLDHLLILGRLLGRMHRIGAVRPFTARPTLNVQRFGHASVELIGQHFIPPALAPSYAAVTRDLLQALDEILAAARDIPALRVHGDCHAGNILWRHDAPHFVDFDDCLMAPAVQDLWLMLSGERPQRQRQLAEILDGYGEFHDFAPRELRLIEALRTLRMLHYSAWLARRWSDPIFPRTFSWFNSERYWGEHILELREQLAALAEEPLSLL